MGSIREQSSIKPLRIEWADFARAVAIIFVVICHCTEGVYTFRLEALHEISRVDEYSAFILFTIGRLGVPSFLFLSGYFLLDREYTSEKCVSFWKKKWFPLFICVEVWVILLSVWDVLTTSSQFSLPTLIMQMLFIKPVTMGHFWYMPMILGVYLFVPIIANGLNRVDQRIIIFPIAIGFLYAFVAPTVSSVAVTLGQEKFNLSLFDLGYIGGRYGIYLIVGWLIKKGLFNQVKAWALVPVFLLSFFACVQMQVWSCDNGVLYKVFYQDAFLAIAGLSLFLLFAKIQHVPLSPLINNISYYSFAIYLIHAPLRRIFAPYFIAMGFPAPVKVALYSLALFAASWILAALIAKIPFVGKKLLYLK